MTAAEHMAEIRAKSAEEHEEIERQLLIEMAARHGALLSRDAARREEQKRRHIRRAMRAAKGGAA